MTHTEKLELVAIEKLIPYPNNARTHSEAQLEKIQESLREFGFVNPILVDNEYGIIAGHGRVEAAKREGLDQVPCVFVEHLTEAQKRAYIIADNRLAEDAGWDMDLLRIELQELQDMDFNLSLTGFDSLEIDDLTDFADAAEDDDYTIELPAAPKAKLGEIYRLGRHRLICGDCTETKTVARLMDGRKADLYLTDPPYNVDYEGKTKDRLSIQNDAMSDNDFRIFLTEAFSAADSVMKDGAAFYIWHADSEGYSFRGASIDVGWQVRQCLIWNKSAMVMGRQDYHWKHEPCLYGWKPGASHLWASDRKQTTVLDFERPNRNAEHPTMKPVKLFDYQIRNNTIQGDAVYDSFAGSGTTIIACEQNGRDAYCAELDPRYVDVIIDRWETLTGEKSELLESR